MQVPRRGAPAGSVSAEPVTSEFKLCLSFLSFLQHFNLLPQQRAATPQLSTVFTSSVDLEAQSNATVRKEKHAPCRKHSGKSDYISCFASASTSYRKLLYCSFISSPKSSITITKKVRENIFYCTCISRFKHGTVSRPSLRQHALHFSSPPRMPVYYFV